jgi:hypothetical protein
LSCGFALIKREKSTKKAKNIEILTGFVVAARKGRIWLLCFTG